MIINPAKGGSPPNDKIDKERIRKKDELFLKKNNWLINKELIFWRKKNNSKVNY